MPNERKFSAQIPVPSKLNITDESTLAQSWRKFLRSWNNYEIASNLKAEPNEYRCSVLLAIIGDDALERFDGFRFDNDNEKTDIDVVLKKFEEFCVGSTHEAFESYRFHVRNQEQTESIDAYVAELRKLAKGCNFGDFEDRMLRDRILVGCKSEHVREKLLEDSTLTLKKAIEIARAYEASQHQLQEMSAKEGAVDRVSYKGDKPRSFKTPKGGKQSKFKSKGKDKCTKCGKERHKRIEDCPAAKAECNKCSKVGHYAAVCFSKNIRRVVSDDDVPVLGSISGEINTVDSWNTELLVNSQKMEFRIDTGADVSVIPDRCFKNMNVLKKTEKRLYGPGGTRLEVLGVFTATLESKDLKSDQDLYVIKGLKKPLLGRPAIEALGVLKRVDAVEGRQDIKDEYPSLFKNKNIGKIDSPYLIRLKDDARPFSITAPRRLPLPMKDMVEAELQSLQELGIIRPVTKPTDWCAPIVAVPKSTPGKVRICVDYTKLNESVKRENFPLPAIDQLLAQLDGATVFSKLDCNKGFHQIPLSEESQELTTFITPFGRFCYQRLPFGISSGPEVFHREMTHILAGLPGVVCDIDDILIGGKGQEEHDARLRKVLDRLDKAGVTLNEKCELSTKEIKFLGHIITPSGISIDPSKVEAIAEMPTPEDVPGLRRLLGMVNHVAKFAPNLAEVSKPLRDLLKKDSDWIWEDPQEKSFQEIKKLLSSAPVLQHYGAKKPTKVSADASSFGMGGVLLQKDAEGWKPVQYASRSFTDTEQRYAQVEKEALAMTWCCEKFADFLVGLPSFQIETDHKPLLALMKTKQLDELTPRIQRFRMRMMRFSYQVEYVAGKHLVTADALSRAPGRKPREEDRVTEEDLKSFVQSVVDSIPASDMRLEEVRREQMKDFECCSIIKFCQEDYWPESAKKDFPQFYLDRHLFTVVEGLLLMGTRLVIPQVLRKEMLDRVHEGHQGIVKCRALARTCIWWPGISKDIATLVEKCSACERYRTVPPQPLIPTATPDFPWQRVGTDLFEWLGEHYLLVVDYYSRWIEVSHLKTMTSNAVIHSLKTIFARFGIPELVYSDNGTQYTSSEFARFSQFYGFKHVTSSPHHPSGNGEAERAVQTIKNLLKKEQDPFLALLSYRSTPLSQGQSPSELLMKRKLRTRVPLFRSREDDDIFRKKDTQEKERQKFDFDRRHRAKELPTLKPGQPVWLKTPKTTEATVLPDRSVCVKTGVKETRRNRSQLRLRDPSVKLPEPSSPKETALSLGRPSVSTHVSTEDTSPDYQAGEQSSSSLRGTTTPLTRTRSGRVVNPPKMLDL